MSKIVLATGNAGKVRELDAMLAPLKLHVVAQSEFDVPEVAETGTTFVENAIIKARHAARITGLPAIADDSGLVVDALGGAPGIYSARYSGEGATDAKNIDKLLAELQDVPMDARSARFICCLVYLRHADDPTPIICEGAWEGRIAREAFGEGGFGYDPVFYVPALAKTAAELSKEEKNAVSHRGQALKALLAKLGE
ncbi:XTP/dITP diphosphatase [Gallaecimonas pentaromativorans]|uniref:dITP/XTP pyrophosphatase n=1 Tax=Gallaecimonas pentaromativorans TaxID=584787 RepID=A0A3N1PPK0_9GAMM|nr:XTP/dITP diphosphatase [Gallaecimonas pentaromativorans]MED5523495.1 XTP/dITP diphosphatase [Pseudomonadota bacterium]ROQ30685.1 XTP/dITP diphosphohydrolase [Gallaecimonas pentaromativorans]